MRFYPSDPPGAFWPLDPPREPLLLFALGVVLALPACIVLVEVLASLLPARKDPAAGRPPRIAVLIPAHDEEAGLPGVLQDLLPHLEEDDRVLVVADNCSDRTAAVARVAGVEVLERQHDEDLGKPFAVRAGLKLLAEDPPDVVVFFDADCRFHEGGPRRLAEIAAVTGRPVQARFLMDPPPNAALGPRLRAFGIALKNLTRPRGLHRLGIPVSLTGSGIALVWSRVEHLPRTGGSDIAEDLVWGWALACAGHPPRQASSVLVRSGLPGEKSASSVQVTRWEHGYLRAARQWFPRLLWAAVVQRRPSVLALALDCAVPPLGLVICLLLAHCGVGFLLQAPTPVALGPCLLGSATLALAAFLTWIRDGRPFVSFLQLALVPIFLLQKMGFYLRSVFRRETTWKRTPRGDG